MHFYIPAFSYSITRPYPYAWFTPVAVIGGITLLSVFSIINYISNGYTLVVTTTADPQGTIANHTIFRKWPHYLTDRIQPSCNPANIEVNSQVSTNQSGLIYTITGVEQNDSVLPSLTYMNNVLETCTVNNILLDMDTLSAVSWSQGAQASWVTTVQAFVSCDVTLETGAARVNLTGVYNLVPAGGQTVPGISRLIVRDKDQRASLWWAESLLSYYWSQVTYYLTKVNRDNELSKEQLEETGRFASLTQGSLLKGVIYYTRNESIKDPRDLSFFNMDYSFGQPTGTTNLVDLFVWWKHTQIPNDGQPFTTKVVIDWDAYPPIWEIADSLGKSMYSAVMTDLGQVNTTISNIVQSEDALRYFSSNFTWYYDLWSSSGGTGSATISPPGPASAGYETLRDSVGPLGITPSVISTKYICQIPHKRSSGNIALSIILADLVLLQAAWKLYVLIVDWLLVSRIPGANCCEACGTSVGGGKSLSPFPSPRQEESIELLDSQQSSRLGYAGPYSRLSFNRESSGMSLGLERPQRLGK